MAQQESQAMWFKHLERAVDEFFEDVLKAPWRGLRQMHDAIVRDCGDRYEIEVAAAGIDPGQLEIEVVGPRLTVCDSSGTLEGSFAFAAPIDAEQVKARWSDGLLLIVVPKHKSRRVPVEKF